MLVACRLAGLSALETRLCWAVPSCRFGRSRWLHTAVFALDGRMTGRTPNGSHGRLWRPARRIFVEIPFAFPAGVCPSASKSRPITAQFAGNRLRSPRAACASAGVALASLSAWSAALAAPASGAPFGLSDIVNQGVTRPGEWWPFPIAAPTSNLSILFSTSSPPHTPNRASFDVLAKAGPSWLRSAALSARWASHQPPHHDWLRNEPRECGQRPRPRL